MKGSQGTLAEHSPTDRPVRETIWIIQLPTNSGADDRSRKEHRCATDYLSQSKPEQQPHQPIESCARTEADEGEAQS